mmetsp:Transcript_16683/g.46121  ORF Transcript_16683/g.46121 Transcript_16683/m.46121 type:complete len:86 (+) Transcript_16683:110-367(+)
MKRFSDAEVDTTQEFRIDIQLPSSLVCHERLPSIIHPHHQQLSSSSSPSLPQASQTRSKFVTYKMAGSIHPVGRSYRFHNVERWA